MWSDMWSKRVLEQNKKIKKCRKPSKIKGFWHFCYGRSGGTRTHGLQYPKRCLYVFCTQLFTYSPYIPLKRPIFDQCFRCFRTEKFCRWSKMWSFPILTPKERLATYGDFYLKNSSLIETTSLFPIWLL